MSHSDIKIKTGGYIANLFQLIEFSALQSWKSSNPLDVSLQSITTGISFAPNGIISHHLRFGSTEIFKTFTLMADPTMQPTFFTIRAAAPGYKISDLSARVW